MKIFFFGGSFDPPHIGHKHMFEYCLDICDRFIFIPLKKSPHKVLEPLAESKHRIKMIEILISHIQDNSHKASIDPFEINSSLENSYTIDTLNYLKKKYINDSLYMVLGEDQLAQLPNWKDFKDIIKSVKIICFKRKGSTMVMDELLSMSNIIDFEYKFSSSSIRNKILNKNNFKNDTTDEIHNYITKNLLYQKKVTEVN